MEVGKPPLSAWRVEAFNIGVMDLYDLFDGSANIRHYERAPFMPRQCELFAFHDYDKYTVTHLLFEGRNTFVFIIKDRVVVEAAPHGTFAHHISKGAALTFSVGGLTYCADSKLYQVLGAEKQSFVGFDSNGVLRLVPDGGLAAVDAGVVYGAEASPFLVVNGKRLKITDETKRSRDRLLLGQLLTGEPVFIYIKGVDVARAADYALQLGCQSAAVIGNERRIDIYSKSITQDRQSGCRAVFTVY